MRNDQVCRLNQRIERCDIDIEPGNHLVGYARQPRDFRRDRLRWLTQAAVDAHDIANHALIIVGESDCPDFNDLVLGVAQTSRLSVDQNREIWERALYPRNDGPRHKFPEDPKAAAQLQALSCFLIVPTGHCRCRSRTLPRCRPWRLPVTRRVVEQVDLSGAGLHVEVVYALQGRRAITINGDIYFIGRERAVSLFPSGSRR
ncbi:hypothetical protein BOSEA31B_20428 [Hyphomicrobiales bacterium]|nr:hypothetical protein BOSEA31B_20428 [Hyphomicrobiales bacterium]